MKTPIIPLSLLFAGAGVCFGLTASDSTLNYGGGWTNGSNGGSGFGAWDLTNNNNDGSTVFSGYFTGNSTDGAGDINTSGTSFGIFANPGSAFAVAGRDFGSSLSVNDLFTFVFAVNFDNGNKGFSIQNDSDAEVFNFNLGSGAAINTAFTDNSTIATYDYGGSDAVLTAELFLSGASTLDYQISRTSSSGFQGVLFSGSISGITGTLDSFTFYNSGTDSGQAENNLYFNSLSVTNVPEPSSYAFLAGFLGLTFAALRRRR